MTRIHHHCCAVFRNRVCVCALCVSWGGVLAGEVGFSTGGGGGASVEPPKTGVGGGAASGIGLT